MHELAVCQALLSQVSALAEQHHAATVESIKIQWGPLSGVEIVLLQQAFNIAKLCTLAKDAKLIVQLLPVHITCEMCGQESEVSPNRLICKQCGNWRTQVCKGDEMLLSQVVFEKGCV